MRFAAFMIWMGACVGVFANAQSFEGIPAGLSVLDQAEAERVFDEIAGHTEIPFAYPKACQAKAQKIVMLLEDKGIVAGKAFVEGAMYYLDNRFGQIYWAFHVAPIIMVKSPEGEVRPFVIDLFLSNKLLAHDDWIRTIKDDLPELTRIDQTYFTTRFVYMPSQKDLAPTEYDPDLLENDMEMVLKKYRQYLDQLEKRRVDREKHGH